MPKPKRLWIDLETYSTVDLKKATPYRYTEDPEFLILMGSCATDVDLTVRDYTSQAELLDHVGEWIPDPEVIKVAHNAPFERICFSKVLGMPVGKYLDPRMFHDTQAVAGVKGWPQKLATLAPALGAEKKDEAGTHLINWFCKPDRNGNRRLPEDHPEKWAQFVAYCNQDVVSLMDVDRLLGDFPTETEREVYYADQLVNDIGLPIDVETIRVAARAVELNAKEHERELADITGLAKPNNPVTLRQWFERPPLSAAEDKIRIKMPDLRAETVEAAMARMEHQAMESRPEYRALELRQELAGTASKKFAAALYAMSSDGRIRGAFRYFGAHTGRWSGRGAQPQNLPRHTFGPSAEDLETLTLMRDLEWAKEEINLFEQLATDKVIGEALLRLEITGRLSPDELKRMVRASFVGPSCGEEEDLTVVDYSSIEARVIAWLGGEEWALKAFALGRDIYVETAERMGGLTRAQGKIAVLALGYAGGVNSLRNMSGQGFYYNPKTGKMVDAGSLGQARGEGSSGAEAIKEMDDDAIREKLVNPWRRANPNIVRLWGKLEEAYGTPMRVGPHLYTTESEDKLGRAVHLHLPSGRAINYHGVKWEKYPVKDPKTGRVKWKEGWRYADPKNPFNRNMRIGTYGGRLAENATQAVARDILAEALARLLRAGKRPVGHVHDEILTEGGDLSTVEKLMTMKPKWAKGLPIDGEGFVCRRYKKG